MALKRKAARPAKSRAQTVRDKVLSAAAFVASAIGFYYLSNLPAAVDLKSLGRVEAGASETVVLLAPRETDLLSYQGGTGETVDVRLTRARLHEDTLAALRALGIDAPAAEGDIGWITRDGRGSQTFINVRAPVAAGLEAIHLLPGGPPGRPRLKIQPLGAALEIEMAVPLGDAGIDPGSSKQLFLNNVKVATLPGAFSVKALIAAGGQLDLQFGTNFATSAFVPGGSGGKAAGLVLEALGTQQAAGADGFDFWACAAPRGNIAWNPRAAAPGACNAATPSIRVTRLDLNAERLALGLTGSAFVMKNGDTVTDDWLSKLEDNKLIAALLALFYAALARWIWVSYTGRK